MRVLRSGTGMGGDGKSNKEARRGTSTWWDPGRVGMAVTSGRGGVDVSPNRSIPESSEEEGDIGIPASTIWISKGSWPSLNSSHTSEEFLKSEKWQSGMSSLTTQSTKVEVSLWLGVTRESVLSIDVVGLSRRVWSWVMAAAGGRVGGGGGG